MKRLPLLLLAVAVCASCSAPRTAGDGVKTTFQDGGAWTPYTDVRADAVMVYGVGGNPSDRHRAGSIENRIKSWQERGYKTHFMTGIAWGGYQDYFTGQWDGKWHLDEGQVRANGDTIWHGRMVPYIVPTLNYLEYFKECHLKRVIDAGIDHIFFEEPEFWCWGGYSDAFKREWKDYYGTEWRPQHESPEATYMSSKLKYHLYYRALDIASSFAKEYGKSKGMDVKCYVPTHSLLNYSQWHIVSPEASLASLPGIDGYIAQVWTGTSREPDYFDGVYKERVFETAYLEYGCMRSMTAPTGRKVFFLTDPIEDWPRDWEDYHRNYHATFTAQLLYPEIADYEIMPWPGRIYRGYYNASATSKEKIRIPKDYSTMMQVMVNALNEVPVSEKKLSGSQGISVMMANSLMFQRFPTHEGYEDPQLSNFYGLAMPLVKRGVPVGITHLENVSYPQALGEVKVLLMSYSNMKPLDPDSHKYIAEWVKKGGILIYCCDDKDPFQGIQEWWNTGDNHYAAPSDHLFSLMGIAAAPAEGEYAYGKGTVQVIRTNPKEFVMKKGGDATLLDAVKKQYAKVAGDLQFKNSFHLERGPFELVAVMDESVSEEPFTIEGVYIDLYDPKLPVYTSRTVTPGTQDFLYNVKKAGKAPKILAAASRAYDIVKKGRSFSFVAKSPLETINVSRVLLPAKPVSVLIDGKESLSEGEWDETSKTWLLRFDNNPDGVSVQIKW